MLNKLQSEWKGRVIFFFAMIMMSAVFFSRIALSVAMTGFIITSFLHDDPKGQVRKFLSSPLLLSMALLFTLPLLTGLWSSDKPGWLELVRIKLPLLLLPLAFSSPIRLSQKQHQWLAGFFIGLMIVATCWSFSQYITHTRIIHEEYLKAKTMITPLLNDHVRFSWLVSFAVLLCIILLEKRVLGKKAITVGLVLACTWFIVYLHLLAARTGLFCLYGLLAGLIIWLIIKKAKVLQATGLLMLLLLLPFAAYLLLPTFRNRARYIYYDYGYFKEAHYLPGGNDAGRVISLKAGWGLMKDHAPTGVGFGDILPATMAWYDTHYPGMLNTDKIYPSSEWLIYGVGAGIGGFLLFTGIMAIPFFLKKYRKMPAWLMLNAMVAFGFLFDIGLEVQFGVFIYSFNVLWCWRWLGGEPELAG